MNENQNIGLETNENIPQPKTGILSKNIISKIIECVGAIIVILGCFMPIYTINFLGMTKKILYIEGDGVFALIFAVVAIILTCIGKQLFSIIPLTGSILLFSYTIFNLQGKSNISDSLGSMGAAAFVIPLGAILMIVGMILSILWKTDRKTKKSNIAAITILILSIAFSIAFIYVSEAVNKSQTYKEATEAMNEKKYDDAIEKFKELADYKDSKDKILECKYLNAESEKKEGNYEEAIEIYTALKDYKDCTDKITECKYLNATEYIKNETYDDAIQILNEIKTYKDSETLIDNCNFYILKYDYEFDDDISALIDGINEKCPNNKEAKKYVNKQISEKLLDYDNEEYYEDAISYLKKISGKWDVKKELKTYENKQKILDKYDSIKSEYMFNDEESAEYAMTDMNNDGINEIIVSHGTCDADWKNDFYHLNKSGQVVCVGTLESPVSFYGTENGNGIYAVHGRMGYETRYHIFFKKDNLKIKVVEDREVANDDYYSNDKPIEMESSSY